MLADTAAIVAAVATVLVAYVSLLRELRRTRMAVGEVHAMVNSRLDAALARVDELKQEITLLQRELVSALANARES